ncbi:MAG: LysR substrate-binding domain-containing protein [Janthinobacterium lividum]
MVTHRRIDLNDVRLLVQVIEQGSYTAAARVTGIPKSTISQRIAGLESAVGTGLIRRTSRSFSLTEAGADLLPHARAIENVASAVECSIRERGEGLRGTLRLSCSAAVAQFMLSRLVHRFLSQYDQVTIRLEVCNRAVDLIGGGYDLAVRDHVDPLRDSILRQRVIARAPWVLVASPAWIEVHGAPCRPQDIPTREVLCFSETRECPDWSLTCQETTHCIEVLPRLSTDDLLLLRASALGGGGIACLPEYLLRDALGACDLVQVLPEWSSQVSTISVVTPPKAQSSRLATAFSDFLAINLKYGERHDGPTSSRSGDDAIGVRRAA